MSEVQTAASRLSRHPLGSTEARPPLYFESDKEELCSDLHLTHGIQSRDARVKIQNGFDGKF